jgi:hypothetical protein
LYAGLGIAVGALKCNNLMQVLSHDCQEGWNQVLLPGKSVVFIRIKATIHSFGVDLLPGVGG